MANEGCDGSVVFEKPRFADTHGDVGLLFWSGFVCKNFSMSHNPFVRCAVVFTYVQSSHLYVNVVDCFKVKYVILNNKTETRKR